MEIEARAANLIDSAMQRINFSLQNTVTSSILQQISNEKNLLRKISNLIHLLVICNQRYSSDYNEIYNSVKRMYKDVPYESHKLSEWLQDYFQRQKDEMNNFKIRLNHIQVIIKDLSEKIMINSSKNNIIQSLNEQINELKHKLDLSEEEKKENLQKHAQKIENIKNKLTETEDQLKKSQKEISLLKEKYSDKDKISQSVENLLKETEKIKIDHHNEIQEIKCKLQFEIDTQKEKNCLLRNDLNYALRQKIEYEDKLKTTQDELERKKAECLSLKAILNDHHSEISSFYLN
ncbi:hypothetical protein TRFO_09825 [Tritrichomonas foetus]|uniref:Uncharacterized protein n=1 Tax=Tritrichomonas foetus TaxID=1144522 RepID=A0A1J4JGT3_9EUKA|nr:hypothetical protein TRFO_09825 [Tritrichomonas foetus]|eukprot:OHS96669.1 hypothetical protein TRFO_09825 [Tritrichomonas foetus]